MANEWFESLDLDQRVLTVSTVDSKIVQKIKAMYQAIQERRVSVTMKFRMRTTDGISGST